MPFAGEAEEIVRAIFNVQFRVGIVIFKTLETLKSNRAHPESNETCPRHHLNPHLHLPDFVSLPEIMIPAMFERSGVIPYQASLK